MSPRKINGKDGFDITLKFNSSTIKFTIEGDIIINAKRHIIYNRKLSLDNCTPEFVEKSVEYYSKGEKEFSEFLERESLELEVKDKIEAIQESWV